MARESLTVQRTEDEQAATLGQILQIAQAAGIAVGGAEFTREELCYLAERRLDRVKSAIASACNELLMPRLCVERLRFRSLASVPLDDLAELTGLRYDLHGEQGRGLPEHMRGYEPDDAQALFCIVRKAGYSTEAVKLIVDKLPDRGYALGSLHSVLQFIHADPENAFSMGAPIYCRGSIVPEEVVAVTWQYYDEGRGHFPTITQAEANASVAHRFLCRYLCNPIR